MKSACVGVLSIIDAIRLFYGVRSDSVQDNESTADCPSLISVVNV